MNDSGPAPQKAAVSEFSARVAELPRNRPRKVDLSATGTQLAALARELGVRSVNKMRMEGWLSPAGEKDWRLEADVSASVTQRCVVTLAPVTSRLRARVIRKYIHGYKPLPEGGAEYEIPDDSEEELGDVIDLLHAAFEGLALEMPQYPRASGAALAETAFPPPGERRIEDADLSPFASLRSLRRKLGEKSASAK